MKVSVRMYNVGFGDCFLLTIHAPDRPRKILIDCGKHTLSTTPPSLGTVVERVLEDIREPDGPRIDVLVATHRHQDHVAGFAAEGWAEVRVGEIWMPWTEDPEDPVARGICERQSSKAEKAKQGLTALRCNLEEKDYLLGYAGNNLTNAAAMNRLHRGFLGSPRRRFLPEPAESKAPFRTELLPGVEIYVLGPSRDPEVMREMDPPGGESLLRAWSMTSRQPDDRPSPFGDVYALTREQYETEIGGPLGDDFPVASEGHLSEESGESAVELLARLEEAVNATSLVLLFHIGESWLLFPGDAQWGTWNLILSDPLVTGLLGNLTFYKIGHHGSHNATPLRFVERFMRKGIAAMLPYGKVAKWPSIPRAQLLERLDQLDVAVARADQALPDGYTSVVESNATLAIEVTIGR